jgi:hypothetical protein
VLNFGDVKNGTRFGADALAYDQDSRVYLKGTSKPSFLTNGTMISKPNQFEFCKGSLVSC